MEIYTNCLCGKAFAAPPHLAGSYVACPHCGRFMPVPRNATREVNPTPWIVGGVVVLLLLVLCSGVVGLAVWGIQNFAGIRGGSAMGVESQDYADARRTFRTRLIRRGPSPQQFDYRWGKSAIRPPSGAALTTFNSGGRELAAIYDQPRFAGKKPVVIFLHGGFAFGDGDYEMAEPYRRAGFVVVMPILRGENGQAGDFTLYYDEVDDVLALADSLGEFEHVDTNNVFVAGHSAGGALAILSAMASDRFRAAASLSGSMNQKIMLDDAELIPFDPSDSREVSMRSPEAFAGSFKCPARLYYGSQEFLLSPAILRTAVTASGRGLDVQAVQVAGDHFTSVDQSAQRSADFFRQRLAASSQPMAPQSPTDSYSQPEPPIVEPIVDPVVTVEPPVLPEQDPVVPPAFDPGLVPPEPDPGLLPPLPNAPSSPPVRTPGSPFARNGPVVVFQLLGYEGRMSREAAARFALIRVRWFDPRTLVFDDEAGELILGVRGRSLNTGEAKSALESRGFRIGATSYHPSGRPTAAAP